MNKSLSGCRFMVTGGAGFIGVNLIRRLLGEGAEVLNFDQLTYAGSPQSLSDLENLPEYHFVRGDVADGEHLQQVVCDFEPERIIHLAAESHVDRSIVAPLTFVRTNVTGTACLLEAALAYWNDLDGERKSQFRLIHVSSDEVFGSAEEGQQFQESSPYAPRSPYSASKAGSDHLVRAWHQTYGLPVIVCNGSNNYGPFQFPEKLMPLVILAGISGTKIPIYGDGKNLRDWIHVDDHCEALLRISKDGRSGEDYVIGGGSEISNLELVHQLLAVVERVSADYGEPLSDLGRLVEFVPDRLGHDFRYAINSAKARLEFGWQPNVSLGAGLESTVRWYFENRRWWEAIQARKGTAI